MSQPLTFRYIAFLRAINVGGHNVKMDHLRWLFSEIGFTNVETFIASGNVIFDAQSPDDAALATQIEHFLAQGLGYPVATLLRTPAEVTAAAQYQPFADLAETDALSVAFVALPPGEQAQQRLMALQTDIDDLQINGREVYWRCRTRVSDSKVSGAALEKALKQPATVRNITTVRKLAAKYG